MPYSYNVYTGNGSTTQFTVGFSYIRREHVFVSVNYVNTAFTWVNNSTVQVSPAPANATRVEVRRVTPVTNPLVDFTDGSTLVAADLDTVTLQQTYINQEQDDQFQDAVFINSQGLLDAGGKRITNVGDPVNAQDVATKNYVGSYVDATTVASAGDAMTGPLAMGNNKITGLALPTADTDAVNRGYVNSIVANGIGDGDKGDIVVSGSGSVLSIDAGVINDADVNASAGIVASKLSFTQAGTGAAARTVGSKLNDIVSVKDFGAVGDGIVNDTTAIQAALSSGAKCVTFVGGQTYKVQTALTAPANVVIQGNGATIAASTHFTILTVGSGSSVSSLNFTGAGSASYVSGSTAISCVGTNNAPSAPTYVTGPAIENCTLSGFGEYAVWLAYVKGGRIVGNSINNIGYAGVGGVSCEDVVVDGNIIKSISPGTGGGDAYGIFIDRNDGTSEVAWPRSYRCIITNNTIENVTAASADNGQGIDTHGGVSFVIDSNVIKNCECGIFLTASSISGSQALGPKQCVVSNNVIEGGANSIGYGIVVYGAQNGATIVEYAEDCLISGNIVTGHGKQNVASVNATLFRGTKNLNVTGNIFKHSVGSCVFLDYRNISCNISGNTFVDPFDNTYATPTCVHIYSDDVRGYIGNNVYRFENAALGTYVAVNSIRIELSGSVGLDLDFGPSTFLGNNAVRLTVAAATTVGVRLDGLLSQSGSSTISVVGTGFDGITDVVFPKRFPYIPKVSVALRHPFNQGGKFPILGVDTSVAISATGFRIYALPADGTTWSATGTLSFDYFAS